jgi:hypothetical protein
MVSTLIHKAKPGKKHRKYSRNLVKCARYRSERRREKAKLRRVARCNGPVALARYKEMLLNRLL